MTINYRNSAGVDFDSLFDPFVQGTPPAATGFRDSTGTDLAGRYAPISFGSKGPDVGYRTAAGLDVSNLWAAAGTANYGLPINGQTFSASAQSGTTSSSSSFIFSANTGGWSCSGASSGGGAVTPTASGTIPSGATQVQYTTSVASSASTGAFTNGASTPQALTTARICSASATGTPSTVDSHMWLNVMIQFLNASSAVISTTNIQLRASAVGSA